MTPDWLAPIMFYLLVGGASGLLAGLLGVGGGIILVPCLHWLFHHQGMPPEVVIHMAVGTSLAVIATTGLVSTWRHHQKGAVVWHRVRQLAPLLAGGALVGAVVARLLPGDGLRGIVGLFELGLAVYIGLQARASAPVARAAPARDRWWVGGSIGSLSALVGIGGGTLTVPYLVNRGLDSHRAVAVAAACGVPIAWVGAVAFTLLGWSDPRATAGFVFWPAWLPLALSAALLAPVGVRLSHALSAPVLLRVFALFLLVAAVATWAG